MERERGRERGREREGKVKYYRVISRSYHLSVSTSKAKVGVMSI